MTLLSEHISVLDRFARSANLERDAGRSEPLDGYIVTTRALDVVERVAAVAATGASGGAWSLTGPYGSGKSSLALLLDAILGPSTATRKLAWRLVDEASPRVGELIRQGHRRHQTTKTGFHRGLITAGREPLAHTVLRALHAAVLRRFGGRPAAGRFSASRTLKGALEDVATNDPRRAGPSATAIIEIARCLADDAPLLLIIDEFGKNLESIQESNGTDPYLLQQLAEAGQGSGLPIFVLTLQHLSFEDYLAGAESSRSREWAKVQGRFEDIAYVESARETRSLIGTVFKIKNENVRNRVARSAQTHARAMQSLGIADLANPAIVASYYPLHPLTALVLSELCSRYGQHERTLFSFLASPDAASASSFLATTKLPARGPLPSLGLEAVYDYFVSSGTLMATSASRSSRWTEIAIRLRDVHGLSQKQANLAKAVALLNLVSTTGTIRASSQVLSLAGTYSGNALAGLEAAGLVTYRDFVDEYRIWQGTDVNIRRLIEIAYQRIRQQSLNEILSTLNQPLPLVAARHSAEHDVLRIFARRYATGGEKVKPPNAFSPYDGEVLLIVGSDKAIPSLAEPAKTAKPVLAAVPSDLSKLDRVAREVAAATIALKDPAVQSDWVARREISERMAETQTALEHAVNEAFSGDSCRWVLLGPSGVKELSPGRGSAALSEAADLAYPSTPMVGNEMLNRTDLTSQGAKARRLLLNAMIERAPDPNLGLGGYGPEVAMYRAFLERTELHAPSVQDDAMVFQKPTDSSLHPAWGILEREFRRAKTRRINLNDVHAALLSPPIGMKAAVIPVLVTSALLAFRDEVAIYEHGTFKPLLTRGLSERMVRNPGHFDIKHFASTTGARLQVVDALAERLGVRPRFGKHRVANVLSIVGHLVSCVRSLENYTRRTRNLACSTREVRDALVAAVEPDLLLFDSLPKALGFRSISVGAETYSEARAFAESVGEALEELTDCHNRLLAELFEFLLELSAEARRLAIVGQAAALENEVLDPAVRAFVLALANGGTDTDIEWINAIATVVAKKAPSEWMDDDLVGFRRELPLKVAAFQRLLALHAEQRADGGGSFSALRVTITRSDGSEHIGLVGIDQHHRRHADEALDKVFEDLQEIMGSPHRACRTLLALLGERILSEQAEADSGDKARLTLMDEGVRHG